MQYSRADVGINQWGGLECQHRRTEIRRRVIKNGVVVFARQCVICGDHQGLVSKSSRDVLALASINAYDEQAQNRWFDYCQKNRTAKYEYEAKLREAQVAAEQTERRKRYDTYLDSLAWKRKRAIIMDRAGGICECCGLCKASHVHHLTYEHLGDEYLWELKAVCVKCHQKIHPEKDIRS